MSQRRDSISMESTEVPPERSAGEIVSALVAIGANEIHQSYNGGRITGIRWVLTIHGQALAFSMPVRVDGVFRILQKRRGADRARHEVRDREKAERVAWRQLLRWVQSQIAMIQTEMAQPAEVFLPYLYNVASDQTLFQVMDRQKFKMLAPPEKTQ